MEKFFFFFSFLSLIVVYFSYVMGVHDIKQSVLFFFSLLSCCYLGNWIYEKNQRK